MKYFEIVNNESGMVLGVFEGRDEDEAIAAMLRDANCSEEADPSLRAYEVEQGPSDELPDGWELAVCHSGRAMVLSPGTSLRELGVGPDAWLASAEDAIESVSDLIARL
jgi:hypothetical protein